MEPRSLDSVPGRTTRRRFGKTIILTGALLAAAAAIGMNSLGATEGRPEDGRLTEAQAETLRIQKAEYDQAEVAALLDQAQRNNFGAVDDQLLVATLEYRNACRQLNDLADSAATSGVKPAAIDKRLAAISSRLTQRSPAGDESAAMFLRLGSQLKEGQVSEAKEWLAVNCDLTIR